VKDSLLKQAKAWFINYGVLPEQFFAQSLRSYLRVLLYEEEEQTVCIDEIGW